MTQTELYNLLHVLRDSFQKIFGEQFERMILYGSRARGDHRADSDVDVLVVLKGEVEYQVALMKTSELIARLSLENDVLISRTFMSDKQFHASKSPLLLNVRREGVPV